MNPLIVKWAWRILAPLAFVLAVFAFAYHRGASHERAIHDKEVAALQKAVSAAEARAAKITTKVVTEYVDRVRVVHEKGATIVKEVPVYVTPKADAACVVPRGFVRVHDGAARNEPPGAPEALDDAASGVALSTVAEVTADNYRTYNEIAEQLKALQKWVAEQSAKER